MGDRIDALSDVLFLARSAARVRILRHLLESGPATQQEIREELSASRSTVTRTLAALAEREWVRTADGAYRLTPFGKVLTENFLDLLDSFHLASDLAAFLVWFPYREFDLDVEQLREATITRSTDGDPYAPARRQTELFETTDRFRGFLPSIGLEGTKVVHEQITGDALEAEVIVSPSVESTIESGEFATLFREKLRTDRTTVLVAEDVPFYLGLADDRTVQIGVEDGEGFPRALVESRNPSVREWAESVYRRYRQRAREKPIAEF